MKPFALFAHIAIVALLGSAAPARPGPPTAPVAVELFTSQGCSSCPPADAVLERLARDPGVVAISRPVTYWDRLGWKDTLARPENTRRQRAYAARRGSDRVYTPQAVIQGDAEIVGAREAEIRELIAAARAGPAVSIAVSDAGGGKTVAVSGRASGDASVTLLALRSSVPVRIGRGENSGRVIRYTNVVAAERVIGAYSGGAATYRIPEAALRVAGADRFAILVQRADGGSILGARYL